MPELQTPKGTEPSASPAPAPGAAPDPLARLYHMSTTAGVGTQDYVAINPIAIAALLLGFASSLVVLGDIVLVIPALGLACAVVAFVQVGRSNQTQTGRGIALAGLMLCLLLGGGRVAYDVYEQVHVSDHEREINALMHQLADDVRARRYEEAYALFTDRFHSRVSFDHFKAAWEQYERTPGIGGLQSIEWNGEPMLFQDTPGSTKSVVDAMGLYKFKVGGDPTHLIMQFERSGNGPWRISSIPNLYALRKG